METSEKTFTLNERGLSIQDLWRVLRNGIIILLIVTIVAAGAAGAFAKWGMKTRYAGAFTFWINNLSANYDYTSTAQTAGGVAIAAQLVNLINNDAPLRYAVTEYDLAYKLGFLSKEDHEAIAAYNAVLAKLAELETLIAEQEEKLESATELKNRADAALALLDRQYNEESEETNGERMIRLTEQDYTSVKNDIAAEITAFFTLGTRINTAYENYKEVSADENATPAQQNAALQTLKTVVQEFKKAMLALAANYDTENVTVNPASESVKYAQQNISDMNTLLIQADEEIRKAEVALEEAEAAYATDPTAENEEAKVRAKDYLDDLKKNRPTKEQRIKNAQEVYDLTIKMRDLYTVAQTLNTNPTLKDDELGAPEIVKSALESASLLLKVTAAMQQTFELTFEEYATATFAHYNAERDVALRTEQLSAAEVDYSITEAELAVVSEQAKETDEVKELLLRNANATDEAVHYAKSTISASQINSESFMIRMKVVTTDPQKTLAICDAVQETFPAYAKGLVKLRENEENTPLVTLIDPVSSEKDVSSESSKTVRRYALIGAMLGFVLCYGVLFFLDWRKQRAAVASPAEEKESESGNEERSDE